MPVKISYPNTTPKLKEAVQKANAILSDAKLYEIIKARITPFANCIPAVLSPTVVADLMEASTLQLSLRECKINIVSGGRFVVKYPKVLWVNLNITGKCTADALAAMLVHMCVHSVSAHCTQSSFAYDKDGIENYIDTAPYWVQQQARLHLCEIPLEKLSHENLLRVDIKNSAPLPSGYIHSKH